MFKAKVVAHSVAPHGIELITVEASYPRCIHSEVLTHRDRARNAASSRAIPWKRFQKEVAATVAMAEYDSGMLTVEEYVATMVDNCMMKMIVSDPFVPIKWGAEKPGMETGDEIAPHLKDEARELWIKAMRYMVRVADELSQLGVHKSLANRLTEPWMWITVLMTATEWRNFFRLRCHPKAEIHFQEIAGLIKTAIGESVAQPIDFGQWHMPYIVEADWGRGVDSGFLDGDKARNLEKMMKVSAGRCARLSYLTHDGVRDMEKDVELCERLINPPGDPDVIHASPLEHVASPQNSSAFSGPFRGWYQMRKMYKMENIPG